MVSFKNTVSECNAVAVWYLLLVINVTADSILGFDTNVVRILIPSYEPH